MSGRHREEDLAYGSYAPQGESQGGEEGERGFVGDTLNSLLGRRPQGQQSVCNISSASIAKLLIRRHRTQLRPTNHSCMASSSSRTADQPLITTNPHRVNNSSRTADHPLITTNPHRVSNISRTADHPPVPANPHLASNDHLVLHLAGPSFLVNSRVLYMTLVQNSRPSCRARQKSIATLIRVATVHQAITMAILQTDFSALRPRGKPTMPSGMSMHVAICGRYRWLSRVPKSLSGFSTVRCPRLKRAWREADCHKGWLSPELYLRRPPAKNEQYRVDRMLKAAAERGVKVNIIVYKEVS
jgi:hypothetical protein